MYKLKYRLGGDGMDPRHLPIAGLYMDTYKSNFVTSEVCECSACLPEVLVHLDGRQL